MALSARRAHALWLRCDLRLDDNPALLAACSGAKALLPVFVFDPAYFRTPTLAGAQKSSARRARFLLESVENMRRSLEDRGSGLAVALGKPTEVLPRLCSGCEEIFVTKGMCSEESTEEARVEKVLKRQQSKLHRHSGNLLYLPDECGCNSGNFPLMFTNFKNNAEGRGKVRQPQGAPAELPSLPVPEDATENKEFKDALQFLPTLEQLGYSSEEAEAAMEDDPRGVMKFVGGEDAALKRLQKWMFDDNKLKDYFNIRNGMLGEGYSSKLSPWLALGCISPRRIWKEAQRYERERVKNKSTYWLVFELIWRDFYAHMGRVYGDKIFSPGGITGDMQRWRGNQSALESWKKGETGDQLVDANMRELAATGFMSNRGRQNVASYLIFNLGVDWRHGAAHFEELLLDHDPCSNWGNWVAAAGLTGQRVNRFNTKKQLDDYDPGREYVNHWLKGSSSKVKTREVRTNADVRANRIVRTEDKIQMTLDDLCQKGIKKNGRNDGGGTGGYGRGGYGRPEYNSPPRKRARW